MSDKYQAAIVEYRQANLAVRSLSSRIADHLSACQEAAIAANIDLPEDGKSPHLKEAYSYESDGMYDWQRSYDDPAEDYLKDACPHCYAAHFLIQERKEARLRFGVAKRRLMGLAKSLEEGVL